MARRKVKLAYIINDSKRRGTFLKRKKGLFKKVDEITTLCGVEGCAIIFSQNDPQPAIWPSPSGVHTVLSRFRSLPEFEQIKKMQNQESFLMEKIHKGEEQLNKLRNENRKKELTQLMFQCLNAGQIIDNVNMNDLNGLYWIIEQNMKQIERSMEETQAAAVVENHAENVIGSVQGIANNVGAMQTQHLSLNFMTNNSFGDVLPFPNGNNVPNGNHVENVIGSVQGMANNVGAMQTQHLSLNFMTNNNFGDVLPFPNGNNVPNGNHAENVIGSVQGMENNVGAMQTQHLSVDFMTNNNFGDVLSFENGNNVPNGNRAENVTRSVQGMENNVGAMQTQHLSLDFMTNNNFGDVLPFKNGNNVSNGF